MNRSGIQLAVFMSCVRRRSSPVFLRSSRNSSMSRCQVSRYVQTAPLRLPPWFTATAVSFTTFRNGTTPCDSPFVPLMWLPSARTRVQSLPRPPANFDSSAFSLIDVVDAVEVVGHRGQVAARQLRAQRAGVEQRGRARHEVEGRQHFVELDGARFAVDFVQRQAHGHAHEEGLRQLDAGLAHVQEVAVVQGLQAEVVELVRSRSAFSARAQAGQVVLQQLFVEQVVVHALVDELREVVGVGGGACRPASLRGR